MATIDFQFELKASKDDGTFDGYGSVFNIKDGGNDIIIPGAFTETLTAQKSAGRMPAMLWQHRQDEPIGVYKSMEEDSIGLKVSGKLALKTARGAEAYELMKMGAITGMSIGYRSKEDSYDRMTGIRTLKRLDLLELSLVTFPMNDASRISSVKSEMTERDFEQLMQDAGLSRKEARLVMNHGFRHLKAMQDAGEIGDLVSATPEAISKAISILTMKG